MSCRKMPRTSTTKKMKVISLLLATVAMCVALETKVEAVRTTHTTLYAC